MKTCTGAKVCCMVLEFVKPSLRELPDHLILQVGTNDLDNNILPELIAKSVLDAARLLKK